MTKPNLDPQLETTLKLLREHNRKPLGDLRNIVASKLQVSQWTARKLIHQAELLLTVVPQVSMDPQDPRFRTEVLRLLKNPTTVSDIAKTLKAKPDDVDTVLADLQESGYIITWRGTSVSLGSSVDSQPSRIILSDHLVGEPVQFGVVSDMHMCSKAERLDVLQAAYDEFARRGIATVLCPGNYIDGEARFNKHELKVHGIADQCQYAIDNWPQRPGMRTFYIDGDDHEGWYQQREGIEFGRYLMLEAQQQGRDDLVYLGYMEADFELQQPNGSSIVKVIHAGGGSTYALSYTAQKLAESFQGGEKPAVAIIGHYHKMEYCFPRAVHCLQAGCCQDQTRFMRKRKLAAHVGFAVVTIQQDITGSITRFTPDFYPFWDKGYYLRRDVIAAHLRGESV